MKVKLSLESQQLTKEELQCLIQSIRDCEQESFPDKEIAIWIEAPVGVTSNFNSRLPCLLIRPVARV